jgi:hypothetical protein
MKKIIVLCLILSSCTSSIFINPNYNLDNINAEKVLLLPANHSINNDLVDSIYTIAFKEYLSDDNEKFRSTTTLSEIISKIVNNQSEEKLNLKQILSTEEFSRFQNNSANSILLFVPANFSMTELALEYFGEVTYRIYDIKTGELILEDPINLNILRFNKVTRGGLISSMNLGLANEAEIRSSARAIKLLFLLVEISSRRRRMCVLRRYRLYL